MPQFGVPATLALLEQSPKFKHHTNMGRRLRAQGPSGKHDSRDHTLASGERAERPWGGKSQVSLEALQHCGGCSGDWRPRGGG